MYTPRIKSFVALCALVALQMFIGHSARASLSPPGCSANNLIVNIAKSAANVTNGSTVTFTVTVENPAIPSSCDLTLGPGGLVFTPPGPNGSASGTPTVLIPGGTTITNGFGPVVFNVPATVLITNSTITANAKVSDPDTLLHDNPLQDDPAAIDKSISVNIFRPCISVTKQCIVATNNGSAVVVTFSGTVTNCGDVLLTNVVVYNDQPAPNTLVFGPVTLAAGAGASFTRVYTNSQNICGPFDDTLTGSGVAPLDVAAVVTNSASAQCTISYTPCISVTKDCTTAVVGQPQTISGTVLNCGNITLTNINVNDNVVGFVTNVASLAPGASFAYSKTVTAVCGGNTNIVTASASALCGGSASASATNVCVVTENPCVVITKDCSVAVVGQSQTISGFVTNCGNVTLSNIFVSDDVVGSITNVTSLAPGAFFFYSKTVTAECGGNTNIASVSAVSPCGTQVNASATNTCVVTEAPCIAVTKNCTQVLLGETQTVSGIVTNCGNVTLTNISISDSVLGLITNITSLAPNSAVAYSKSFAATDCGTNVNVVTAQAASVCGTAVQNSATNNCIVDCPIPDICVIKEVACFGGLDGQSNEVCGDFAKHAIGVSGGTQNPAFCYRITVTNCGVVDLTNVTVIDDQYGDFTTNFFASASTVFPAGGSITYTFKAEVSQDVTNVVSVSAQSALTGQQVGASDEATVEVIPALVSCLKQYSIDGGPLTQNVTLSDGNPHEIVWYVTVANPGTVNLENVTVTDGGSSLGCAVTLAPFSLLAGEEVTIPLCTNVFACSGAGSVTNSVSVTVDSYSITTNRISVCSLDVDGSNIVVSSECDTTLFCSAPQAARVTGGGRQDTPLSFPSNVRYVTHGGQLGAPVGNQVCEITSDFLNGNPCIHGRWTHVRHSKGGLKGNFHARIYDTLESACLDTNVTPVVVTIGSQTYTNLVYGAGTLVGGVCNPDDKLSGPLPRPAPANKIAFTGIGDYAETKGRRAPQSVLFRVDIEDRGEPGGKKPKGGKPPADRYRIRIWILTQAELQQLRGSGADPYLVNFRNAIAACNGIDAQDGASVPNGTAAFGVRAPDIDDGGVLERGNHQIHPAIKPCP